MLSWKCERTCWCGCEILQSNYKTANTVLNHYNIYFSSIQSFQLTNWQFLFCVVYPHPLIVILVPARGFSVDVARQMGWTKLLNWKPRLYFSRVILTMQCRFQNSMDLLINKANNGIVLLLEYTTLFSTNNTYTTPVVVYEHKDLISSANGYNN